MEENMVKESPAVDNGTETGTDTGTVVSVVILAYEGTEELMQKIWDKMLPGVVKKVMPTTPETSLIQVLPRLLADNEVADKFILVPAGCIPCAPVSFEELCAPLVYVDGQGRRHYDRLPSAFDKHELVTRFLDDNYDPDNELESVLKPKLGRAIEGSYKEGNLLTPVLRGNPCEHIVMEALVRKKYLICSAAGLTAVTQLLQKTLLAE